MIADTAMGRSITWKGHTARFSCEYGRILLQLEHIRNQYQPNTYVSLRGDGTYLTREEYIANVDALIDQLKAWTTYEAMEEIIRNAPRYGGARLRPYHIIATMRCQNSIHVTDWGDSWQYWALQIKAVNTWKIELKLLRQTDVQ